jgi:hypothetical protein
MALQRPAAGAGASAAAPRLAAARLLRALSVADGPALGRLLLAHAEPLPASTWLPWVPFLLASLARPNEAPAAASLLASVAQTYPQALYYSLRSFLFEKQAEHAAASAAASAATAATAAGAEVPVALGAGGGASSLQHAVDLMALLKRHHSELVQDLDDMCDEITRSFRVTADEALLAALHALLQQCYALTDVPGSDPLPTSAAQTLAQIHAQFFSNSNPSPLRRPGEALAACKGAFERDFPAAGAAGAAAPPLTLARAMLRLRKWRHALKARVLRTARRVALAQVSGAASGPFVCRYARRLFCVCACACKPGVVVFFFLKRRSAKTLLAPHAGGSFHAANLAGRSRPRCAAARRCLLFRRAALRGGSAGPVQPVRRRFRSNAATATARHLAPLRLRPSRRLLARHRSKAVA